MSPRSVVDLGCGTGNLTSLLARRWPDATVLGVDSSPEMIERARADHPSINWTVDAIESWQPSDPVDVIYSNAALHWLDGHTDLFGRLRSHLTPGGVLAVQMPDNWAAPTHTVPADVLDDGSWPDNARSALLRDRLEAPEAYAEAVQPATVDLWRTTYYQRVGGDHPVWNWVTGSVLRPVLAALEPVDQDRFTRRCQERYAAAYPPADDGVTTLPFSRLFIVAQVASNDAT